MTSPLEQLPNTYRAFFSGFSSLTVAQKNLIQPILSGKDVILQASTGAGKTEAVLAPATEKLMTHLHPFTIIYIVPTRALALDIHRRIHPIYEKLGLKSGIRTGDGKHFRNAKPHLLIMTPESLDVMLGSHNLENKYFLSHVHMIIIDEVHVFLSSDRGYQLSYMHRRLSMQSVGDLQTIALSATINNAEEVMRVFPLRQNLFYYKQSVTRKLQPCWVSLEDESRELSLFFDDLYRRSNCKKLLVFANSRKKCEFLYELLHREGVFAQRVFIHYSNLSTQERKFVEASFREGSMGVCVATSTLELGIDIGDVDGVVLMEPPPSTMAFLQRIGRGNRRQKYLNFWGVCCGQNAGMQLIRFLAFFELAKEHQVEECFSVENYSVLCQQIISCLYAKKIVSEDSLKLLFKEKSEDIPCMIQHMTAHHWLKATKQPGIYEGGWRYFAALKDKLIWSNFPPTDEEYDVILGDEKIAVLPLSIVRQLKIGGLVRFTGKVLKVLSIEEKKTALEVWVEESRESATQELIWVGFGSPTPFEVAQKMKNILLDQSLPQGLLKRTQRLLEKEREKIAKSLEQPNGIRVHQLGNGLYRYETFLGSMANYILHQLLDRQYSSKIEGFSIHSDEIGLECNEWISLISLKIPHTMKQFQEWVSLHLPSLKRAFSWNRWMYWLPDRYQLQEVTSRLYDPRVLKYFQLYSSKLQWLSLPLRSSVDEDKKEDAYSIELKGKAWSIEDEKKSWGHLSFSEIPLEREQSHSSLTATQFQNYVTQKLCPRWARFQHLEFQEKTHPRFFAMDRENQLRRDQGVYFKKKVVEELQTKTRLFFETTGFSLSQAVKMVALDQRPLFLAQAALQSDETMSGSPDLLYIQHQGSHICLEVWDVKFSQLVSYAQKWRIAFYAYLLENFLKSEIFSLPVKISFLGGIVYRSMSLDKLFKKTSFTLAPFQSWLPRLLAQWKTDSERSSAVQEYRLESSCTSCRYFSYCYQETLFSAIGQDQKIVSRNIESNDFPKNSKHWYFIHYAPEGVRWQCWENGGSIRDVWIHSQDFSSETEFQKRIESQLQKEWAQSISQGKNPHFLVYESTDWHCFQQTFHATALRSLWATHVCWTSIQTVLQTHFIWPIHGQMTPMQVGVCLGFVQSQAQPLSLYHRESFSEASLGLCRQIWSWCLSHLKSQRVVSFEEGTSSLIHSYLAMYHREMEYRVSDLLEFQKNPLLERVKQFRAIGPMNFLGSGGYLKSFRFAIERNSIVSKFRVGDFLKLSPINVGQIQEGYSIVLESYSPEQGLLSVRSLSQKVSFSKNQFYALDEDITDWNAPKIIKVLHRFKDSKFCPEVMQMLLGQTKGFASDATPWVEQWYSSRASAAGLNSLQKQALALPFREKIGLIEGPPGTGKTHLLVWTLMALVAHAQSLNRPIKMLVTAQTHHAIDQILRKVAKTLPLANVFDISLWKYGRLDEVKEAKLKISQLKGSDVLFDRSCLILGATGFGLYQLLKDKNFPQIFDWVIFDESSQILTPYALLSLIFGKGQTLFYGDTQQLSPVLKGNYENTRLFPCSILQELISRYSTRNRLRLNETYRMNADLCKFVSEQWYDNELQSVVAPKEQQLSLQNYPLFGDSFDDVFDPSQSMVLVQIDHIGSQQSSEEEVQWITKAVKRLMEDYAIAPEQIGIISPHRLQRNRILSSLKKALPFALKMPHVDTVERIQGLEFDIVIFSATTSDKEMIHSPFLKEYRRLNVAITRARKKFIFVGSVLFFQAFPKTEKELITQMPFEIFSSTCFQSVYRSNSKPLIL